MVYTKYCHFHLGESKLLLAINDDGHTPIELISFHHRSTFISPTIDRMLLSKHLLAPYVRMTALNLFRRRRMNAERYVLVSYLMLDTIGYHFNVFVFTQLSIASCEAKS